MSPSGDSMEPLAEQARKPVSVCLYALCLKGASFPVDFKPSDAGAKVCMPMHQTFVSRDPAVQSSVLSCKLL
jgi:hypothetical protein